MRMKDGRRKICASVRLGIIDCRLSYYASDKLRLRKASK